MTWSEAARALEHGLVVTVAVAQRGVHAPSGDRPPVPLMRRVARSCRAPTRSPHSSSTSLAS